MTTLSIVTPCYNAERYIEETVRSVIFQEGDFHIDYILVDGGSTDETLAIVRKYKDLIESRRFSIRCNGVCLDFVSEKDKGMYDALGKGFKRVTGDIIAYINADDYYLPHAFSTVADILDMFPEVDWITGMNVGYNEKGQITSCWLPLKYDGAKIRRGVYGTILPHIHQEATFWRKKLLNTLNLDQLREYRFAGDFYLWYTFSEHAKLNIVQSCLAGFRLCDGQLSGQRDKYDRELSAIADKKKLLDRPLGHLEKLVSFMLPAEIKGILNGQIIRYRKTGWWKSPSTRGRGNQ
jgi:hypothetical protein